jgi:cell division protein FtsL
VVQVTVETRVLSVDEAGSVVVRDQLRAKQRWDAILHLGLSSQAEHPKLEMKARDVLDMRIPDNAGRQILGATMGVGEIL